MITPFHALYFANELTRRGGEGLDRLSQSLFDASVDLNPHQVEAALFALWAQLEQWQDDQVKAAQHVVDMIRQDLKAARRAVENAANLTEQSEASEKAAQLERKLSKARRNIDTVEDAAEEKRSRILAELKKRLSQTVEEQTLFTLHWTLK